MNKEKFLNLFDIQLSGLCPKSTVLLQLLHDLRGTILQDLEALLRDSRIGDVRPLLARLEALGLLACRQGFWACTWAGAGVANWRQQLCWAEYQMPDEPVPLPRPGENGNELGPPCSKFRAALFAPGYCWCYRSQAEHSLVLPKLDLSTSMKSWYQTRLYNGVISRLNEEQMREPSLTFS